LEAQTSRQDVSFSFFFALIYVFVFLHLIFQKGTCSAFDYVEFFGFNGAWILSNLVLKKRKKKEKKRNM
jgi:hypothetical protein